MFCAKHTNAAARASQGEYKPCIECHDRTENNGDLLCLECSEGFDECSHCREPLKSGINKRRLAAFKSSAAVEIRRKRRLEREHLAEKTKSARATLEAATHKPAQILRRQLAPLRLACEKACKPHRDKLAALNEEIAAEKQNGDLTAVQADAVSVRQQQAMELCDALCKPHLEQFDKDAAGFIAEYRKKISAPVAISKNTIRRLQDSSNSRLFELDCDMDRLLSRSTNLWFICFYALKRLIVNARQ